MKIQSIVGILLIALGIVALAYQGITYTTREKAIDFGPLKVITEQERTFPLPPVVGVLALIGGVVLMVTDRKRP